MFMVLILFCLDTDVEYIFILDISTCTLQKL